MLKTNFSLVSNQIFFPLVPFFLGLLIRIVFWRRISLAMFDPFEVSFSVAMYLILCLISSRNLRDKKLAEKLFLPYLFSLCLLISLFSLSVFLKAYSERHIMVVIERLKEGNDIITANSLEPVLQAIRAITLVVCIVAIILSEMARHRYKIRA